MTVRPITPPGRIAVDPVATPTRLQLLERVNELNLKAYQEQTSCSYWTVTVLYNTVIYECNKHGVTRAIEVFKGVPT